MKGLKKVALVSAIAAISVGAQAELKALDDTLMGEMTGQAGLTIDVETKWTLGEFMYKDGGSLLIQNLALGGNTNETAGQIGTSYLDNLRLNIDIAGAGNPAAPTAGDNYLSYGMSDLVSLARVLTGVGLPPGAGAGNTDPEVTAVAGGAGPAPVDPTRTDNAGNPLLVDLPKFFGNGDLVIHSTFTDAFQKGGGFAAYANGVGHADYAAFLAGGAGTSSLNDLTFDGLESIVSRAVDFSFGFEVLGLASSAYNPGQAAGTAAGLTSAVSTRGLGNTIHKTDHVTGIDTDTTTTTLISDLSINGYFGPSDMVIRNRGNGFSTLNGAGTYAYGDAISKIETSRYFSITDLDVYIDIAGVRIDNLQIHNRRGDLSGLFLSADGVRNTSSFGFAHGTRDIMAVKDNVLNLSRAVATGGIAAIAAGAVDTTASSVVRQRYYDDGIKLHNKFKGDIDIGALSFGNTGTSIGQLYFTDYTVDSKLTISAH